MASESMSRFDGHLYVDLTQGHSAIISREDGPRILGRKWHAVKCGSGKFYARRENVYMHRELMAGQLEDGLVVDHINGNGLDNRRENLRVVTPAQNTRNLRVYNNPTGFRGVFPHKGKFLARVASDYLGFYETAMEAAFAVNQHLNALDGSIGVRNTIDYDELIRTIKGRRDAIDAQIAIIEGARA